MTDSFHHFGVLYVDILEHWPDIEGNGVFCGTVARIPQLREDKGRAVECNDERQEE